MIFSSIGECFHFRKSWDHKRHNTNFTGAVCKNVSILSPEYSSGNAPTHIVLVFVDLKRTNVVGMAVIRGVLC